MVERIRGIVAEFANIRIEKIDDDSRFIGDMGIDSFQLLVLIDDIENLLEIEINEQVLWQLQTFGDVRRYIEKNYASNN